MQTTLNNFKQTIDIFNKYNLNFFADSGTALGCIRHRGFIPWDHDIDIGIDVKQVNLLLSLQEELKKSNLELLGTDGHKVRQLEGPIMQKYINDIQKPDFCKNLNFGKKKGNYFNEKDIQYGFFFKIKSTIDKAWDIDVFPYAKQYDTDIYLPTAYVSTSWKKIQYFKDINNIIYCRFESLIIPVCVSTFEYLIQLYGRYCLVDDGSGKNLI